MNLLRSPSLHAAIEKLSNIYNQLTPCPKWTDIPLPDKLIFDVKAQDETWFASEATAIAFNRSLSNVPTVLLLNQLKSEPALSTIFDASTHHIAHDLLATCIRHAGQQMIAAFNADCVQFTPHPNYLKLPPLLKHALAALVAVFPNHSHLLQITGDLTDIDLFASFAAPVRAHFNVLAHLDDVALRHIDAKALDKFINQSLLDASLLETYLQFAGACLARSRALVVLGSSTVLASPTLDLLICADRILSQKSLWLELNRNEADGGRLVEGMLDAVCEVIRVAWVGGDEGLLMALGTEQRLFGKPAEELALQYRQAIYVAQFVMEHRIENARAVTSDLVTVSGWLADVSSYLCYFIGSL